MILLSIILLICCSFLFLFGCRASSPGTPESESHEEACTEVLDYANQYERTYLQGRGADMYKTLSKVEHEYQKKMSKLAEQGKWTPSRELGTSMKLYFLVGQFHGAVQSCKVERESRDETSVSCDQARDLKNKIVKLLSR